MSGRPRAARNSRGAVSQPRLPAGVRAALLLGLLSGMPCWAADAPPPAAGAVTPAPGAAIPNSPPAAPTSGAPTIGAPTIGTPAGTTPAIGTAVNGAPVGEPSATGSPAAGTSAPPPTAGASPAGVDPAQAAEDIRDIRGPKYGLPLWVIVASIVAAALLALAAYGIWRWRRQRRRPRALSPVERALQQLDGIRPLMQPASAREFSIAVSDIVRGYIEQRFDVIATHRTTEEFMHDLLETPKPSLARHRNLLAGFLQQCDLVKFGGMSLSMHSIESLHDSARGFVLETAKPDPVISPDPKAAHDTLPAT